MQENINISYYIVSYLAEHWIGLSSVLHPRQHSIGYMGDGFYRSKDPTNSIKVLSWAILNRNIESGYLRKLSHAINKTNKKITMTKWYTLLNAEV